MIIRVDKCDTFGIMKKNRTSTRTNPKLNVNNEVMPPLKDNENFKYLGRYFNFNIHNQKHKKYLLENTNTTLNNIDKLPLHPNNKLNLYNKYFLSNLLWYLTIADITEICVQEKPDSLCHKKLRS